MNLPLILFSGLAADSDVFSEQKSVFPKLIVPEWPTPFHRETLESYCDRLAEDLRIHGECIIGGASFGGIIAQLVAQRLKPRAVILIGSVRSPDQLSDLIQWCRPLKRLINFLPVRFFQFCCAPVASRFFRRLFPVTNRLARQFCRADAKVFKWSLARILDWKTSAAIDFPVFQIHGRGDFVLPIRYTNPDWIIERGGHVISMTHANEVNEFISFAMQKCAD